VTDPKGKLLYWRRRLIALAGLLVLIAIPAGIYLNHKRRPGSVFHPHVGFQAEAPPQPAKKADPRTPAWPLYGYSKDHARFYPAPPTLHPPFHRIWRYNGTALLEFPPAIDHGTLFQLNDSGALHAIATDTGHVRWQRKLGNLAASAPAAAGQSVYVTLLSRAKSDRGRVVALRQSDGGTRWVRDLPSRSESSPMLDRGKLFFGSENGTVYALNAHTGSVIWTYRAPGAVKASPTLKDGKLFFGDYGGHVQAIRESDGRRVWIKGGSGILGGDYFYSTPAVVFGRVFLGNTDGRVYAFDARTGRLAWAHQTGSYVYSSPAVTDTAGLGPTVYVGSYDGTFYALSAFSGAVHWKYKAGGRISGSPTVLGKIVYFAALGIHYTVGLDTRDGHQVYARHNGSFDPVVSDGKRVYLTGETGIFGLEPTRHKPRIVKTARKPKHHAKHKKHRKHKKKHKAKHHRKAKRHHKAKHHRKGKHKAKHHRRRVRVVKPPPPPPPPAKIAFCAEPFLVTLTHPPAAFC
jgi:outer membrane protein assembly factor BamB